MNIRGGARSYGLPLTLAAIVGQEAIRLVTRVEWFFGDYFADLSAAGGLSPDLVGRQLLG